VRELAAVQPSLVPGIARHPWYSGSPLVALVAVAIGVVIHPVPGMVRVWALAGAGMPVPWARLEPRGVCTGWWLWCGCGYDGLGVLARDAAFMRVVGFAGVGFWFWFVCVAGRPARACTGAGWVSLGFQVSFPVSLGSNRHGRVRCVASCGLVSLYIAGFRVVRRHLAGVGGRGWGFGLGWVARSLWYALCGLLLACVSVRVGSGACQWAASRMRRLSPSPFSWRFGGVACQVNRSASYGRPSLDRSAAFFYAFSRARAFAHCVVFAGWAMMPLGHATRCGLLDPGLWRCPCDATLTS